MSIEENQELILKEVIEGYRRSIFQRYQYSIIKISYNIPASINEDTVTNLREYFLNYIYPPYEKRTELNEAFKSLDDYIKHPKKLLPILMDATKLFFKYGRYLPKILAAGLNAMNTFKASTNFEANLILVSKEHNIQPPFDNTEIDVLIKKLPRNKIDEFIASSESLFQILHNKKLIEKIKDVIQFLILVMKKNKKAYTTEQIKGLEIGLEMIKEGDKLFNELSDENQYNLLITITNIEKDNMKRIFSKNTA